MNQCCCGNGLYFRHDPSDGGFGVRLANAIAPPPVFEGGATPSLGTGNSPRGYDPVRKRLLVRKTSGAIHYYSRKYVDLGQLWSSSTDIAVNECNAIVYQSDWGFVSASRTNAFTVAPRIFDAAGAEIFSHDKTVGGATRVMSQSCVDDAGNSYWWGSVLAGPHASTTKIHQNTTPAGTPPGGFGGSLFWDGDDLYMAGTSYLVSGTPTPFAGIYRIDLSGAFAEPTPVVDIFDIITGSPSAPSIRGMVYDERLEAIDVYIIGADGESGWYSINLALTRNIFMTAEEDISSDPVQWICMKPS